MTRLTGKKIVITGGSGFLGLSLANQLVSQGAMVTIVSRAEPTVSGDWNYSQWDGRSVGRWTEAINGSHALVNLAGRTVDCIKTPDHRDEILRSRVESTRAIGQALRLVTSPPMVWVQMSTAHIYGDPPSLVCDEESVEGIGLAPTVARAWEAACEESRVPGQRVVVLRTSFVIGRDQGAGRGAMTKLGMLARLGLGGRVGNGKQGMSWIHETDLDRIFVRAICDEQMSGVYVASSPNPVPQAEFMRVLRRVIKMPIGLPAWEWMVRIGAPLILRTDPELALYGRYVVSKRLDELGFQFEYPDLEAALREIYGRQVATS